MPVAKMSTSYNVLVVHPDAYRRNSVAELVALLKANPDKMNFSSGGFGTPAHLIGEMFKLETSVKATHVPYQQFPQAIARSAERDEPVHVHHHASGHRSRRERQIARAGGNRSEAARIDERRADHRRTGFPNLVVEDWVGFAVKSGTPKEIVDTLNQAINTGAGEAGSSRRPCQGWCRARRRICRKPMVTLIKSQVAQWSKMVKDVRDEAAAMSAEHPIQQRFRGSPFSVPAIPTPPQNALVRAH